MFNNLTQNLKFLPDVTAGDRIGWILAIFTSGVILVLIQRFQVKIERHQLLHSVENEFKELFSKKIATYSKFDNVTPLNHNNSIKKSGFTNINLRTVLGETWNYDFKTNKNEIKQIEHDKQRYWEIFTKNENTYYLASEAFQDTLSWFRRVKKLYKDKIIKTNDLADLWRQILPFGCSGRLYYFAKYFTHTKDIEAIIFVLVETLVNCHKLKMNYAVEYLIKEATSNDIIILLLNNNKFKKLIKKYPDVKKEEKTNNLGTMISKAQQETASDTSIEKR